MAAAQLCHHCNRLTEAPVVVDVIHAASGPGHTVYACPDHVVHGDADGALAVAPEADSASRHTYGHHTGRTP